MGVVMNKKLFGIKVGTFLTAVACIAVAVFIWLLVKFVSKPDLNSVAVNYEFLRGIL